MQFRLKTLLILLIPVAVFFAGVTNGPTLNRDQAVISVVLHDLVYSDLNPAPLSIAPTEPRSIILHRMMSADAPSTAEMLREFSGEHEDAEDVISEYLYDADAGTDTGYKALLCSLYKLDADRKDVSNEARGRIVDAIVDIRKRYLATELPTQIRTVNVNVKYGDGHLAASAYLPGYSDDEKLAVVRLYFPDIFHPSVVTYVLILNGNKWTILYRETFTYV